MSVRTWTGTVSGDWAVTGNWAEGVVPVAADDVVIPAAANDINASLNQSAITLNSLTVLPSFANAIGTATAYLQISATTVTIAGSSQRIKINFGSVQMTTTVQGSSTVSADAATGGAQPIRLLGTHASNKLYVTGGIVGVATTLTSETSTLSEYDVTGPSASLTLGGGCTLTTGNVSNGAVSAASAMTTLTMSGGTVTTSGTGAITTVTLRGSNPTFNSNSTGTITTLNSYAGTADFNGNPAGRTVTTLNQWAGSSIKAFAGNPAHLTVGTWNRNFGSWTAAA